LPHPLLDALIIIIDAIIGDVYNNSTMRINSGRLFYQLSWSTTLELTKVYNSHDTSSRCIQMWLTQVYEKSRHPGREQIWPWLCVVSGYM